MSLRRWAAAAAGGGLGNVWVWVVALVCSAMVTTATFWGVQGRSPGGVDHSASEVKQMSGPDIFQFPGTVMPGGRFYVSGLSVQCSMGWPGIDAAGQSGFFTAAHCFPERNPVHLTIPVADGPGIAITTDLIRPQNGADLVFVPTPTLPLHRDGKSFLLGKPISSEPVSLEWLARYRPKICWQGQRTGFSCGQTRAISNGLLFFTSNVRGGDSGGPVFAVTEDAAFPVGVTHGIDGTLGTATPLLPLIHEWGIRLL